MCWPWSARTAPARPRCCALIAGLLVPAGGSVDLEGGEAELTLPEQAHYLGHRDALKPALSVLENLSFWRDFLGGTAGDLGQCLAAVGLGHATHLPAAYLSAGQRRRLSIARLLVVRRPVWLLDEPTSALDTAGQDLFTGVMRDHLAGGGIIIAATHTPLGIDAQGIADGGRGMTALAALIRRDIRIALRVGGGALIGVLFFLTVTVLMPFAIGPDLALLTRLGPAILWLGALLASLLTLDRLFTADHEDGSLDLIVMGRTPLELACAAKALAHWLAAGRAADRGNPGAGAAAQSRRHRDLGGGADAAGGNAGADLHRHDRRGAGRDAAPRRLAARGAGAAAVDPGADFRRRGVAGRDIGPLPFGTPFSILCALSLVSLVVGPFAAAASLRHGLD